MPEASFSTATSTGTPRPSTYSRRTRWPGPFGATMNTSTPSGGGDVAEADVEAVAEDQGVARGQVGLDRLGVQLPLVLVGGEDHDHVGLLDRLGRREHAQALGLGLGPALRARLQSDPDVDARSRAGDSAWAWPWLP